MLKSIFQQHFHSDAFPAFCRTCFHEAMNVFTDNIRLQIHDGTGMLIHQRRMAHRMGNDGYGKLTAAGRDDGQADSINGNRAFSTIKGAISLGIEMVMTRAIPSFSTRDT